MGKIIIYKEGGGIPGYASYAIWVRNGVWEARIFTENGLFDVSSDTVPVMNSWSHIAITYDGSSLKIFINGVLKGETATFGAIVYQDKPLNIGNYNENPVKANGFPGLIDELAIFNRALTPQEIASLYNEKKVTLALSQQWNFVSFQKLPSEPTVENVLGTDNLSKVKIIWGFDNENKKWLKWRPNGGAQNKITLFEFGKGYWIYMDESVTIDMTGWVAPLIKTVPLYPGWNLVGWVGDNNRPVSDALNSLSGNWSVLWTWKNNNWKVKHESLTGLPYENIESLENNSAYWIRVKNETQWQQ
ncbi:MAG: LamG domain-containing protein [Candidatus Omnitrophica bacterium]|nr:LamG domain-containing protein [Candidatus Omnitrophota bacterium]